MIAISEPLTTALFIYETFAVTRSFQGISSRITLRNFCQIPLADAIELCKSFFSGIKQIEEANIWEYLMKSGVLMAG